MRPHGAEGLKHSVSCAVFHSRESVSPLPSPEPRSTGSIMKKPSDTLSEEKLELYTRNLLDEVVNSKLLEVNKLYLDSDQMRVLLSIITGGHTPCNGTSKPAEKSGCLRLQSRHRLDQSFSQNISGSVVG